MFELNDRVRVVKDNANGANVRGGDIGVIISVTSGRNGIDNGPVVKMEDGEVYFFAASSLAKL